ncbi:MAG: putative metal-binding motif-containing protein [Flavobacteriales bacterium]|nr:putative metal-binding motif-containing protein [Flavobacteriales bacterium]
MNNGDCDDTDPSISPVALDVCLNGDGIDNDCYGQIDEDGPPQSPRTAMVTVTVTRMTRCLCGTVGAAIDNGDCNDNNRDRGILAHLNSRQPGQRLRRSGR